MNPLSPGQGSLGLVRKTSLRARLPAPKESQIELTLCHFLRSRRIMFFKTTPAGFFDAKKRSFRRHVNPYTRKGVPDLICVIHGHFVGFEVKSEKGRQSPDQIVFQRELEAAGGSYFVVRSIDDVEAALERLNDLFENILTD